MSPPYRLIRDLSRHGPGWGEAEWTPAGVELGRAGERPARVPGFLLLEAMAQVAGVVLGGQEGDRWLLAAIDGGRIETTDWEVPVLVRAELTRRSDLACRMRAQAAVQGRQVGSAGLLMARLRLP